MFVLNLSMYAEAKLKRRTVGGSSIQQKSIRLTMDLRILSDDELLALAGEINLELLRRVPVKAETPAAETPDVLPTRCPYCGGTGWRITTLEFCTCAMGRDLQRAEKGALSRFAPADLKYSSPEPDYAQEPEEDEEGS